MFKGAGNCAVLRHIQFDRWQSTSTCSRHLMMLYEHYNHLQISCNFSAVATSMNCPLAVSFLQRPFFQRKYIQMASKERSTGRLKRSPCDHNGIYLYRGNPGACKKLCRKIQDNMKNISYNKFRRLELFIYHYFLSSDGKVGVI
jgi:hypothetical protein